MGNQWTDEQKQVITQRNKNILVSAAAGSGKTAVLVERIIQRILDNENPIDIDKLVVVTFTNAAAAQMKDRIRQALEDMLEENPEDDRIHRQLILLNNAKITTIDSFCLELVKSNYMYLDIEPGFRIGDTGELELMQSDICDALLERWYEKNDADFIEFVEAYGGARNDKELEILIRKLYRFSCSYPWPMEWLSDCVPSHEIKTVEEFNSLRELQYYYEYLKNVFEGYRKKYEEYEKLCLLEEGPVKYYDAVLEDIKSIEDVLETKNFYDLCNSIRKITFSKLKSIKKDECDEALKNYVKEGRDDFKKTQKNISESIDIEDFEECLKDINAQIKPISMLVTLTKEFSQDFIQKKREKNIIDFNDMEHLALDLLVKKVDGKKVYSKLSEDLSRNYEEIMIDEYQDSNMLQEEILTAVSRHRFEELDDNMFMVGDVKQSIYKFRLARPDLFMEKYDAFPKDKNSVLIELSKNFRSRKQVLDGINKIFFSIMRKEFGGIDYNDEVKLNAGMQFAQPEGNEVDRIPLKTKLYAIDKKSLETDDTTAQAEAIASIIKKILDKDNGNLVWDSKKGKYRLAKLSDIVILRRTVASWGEKTASILMENDIPARTETSSGYYNTFEVELMLNMLSIIDNPMQDVSFVSVITSYFGNMNIEEMARIRAIYDSGNVYSAVLDYRDNYSDDLTDKINEFLNKLQNYREMSRYLSINELINKLSYDTGFYDFVSQMPSGKYRALHLDMLCEIARKYEKTSYHGLFNFLRYIERLKKYEIDNIATDALGEENEVVRIMTIHKSKGLEFPIVILAGLEKKYNMQDANSSVIIDSELGIGVNVYDNELRTKTKTVMKNAISRKIRNDNKAEELRILYVALTRAKENLIMLTMHNDLDKKIGTWQQKTSLTYNDIEKAENYADLMLPIILNDSSQFEFEIMNQKDYSTTLKNAKSKELEKPMTEEQIKKAACEDVPYPYEYAVHMKNKISVSEIKHEQKKAKFLEDDSTEHTVKNQEELENNHIYPRFIKAETENIYANRGTAYHRVLECLDYNHVETIEDIGLELKRMLEAGLITEEQNAFVKPEDILTFCESNIGKRIKKAFLENKLYREKQFVMSVPARDIVKEAVTDEEDTVLIQGVIDLFFIEDDKIVLVDYKTDRVKYKGGFDKLKKLYKVQLDYYAEALSRAYDKEVIQKIIYSFDLEEEALC